MTKEIKLQAIEAIDALMVFKLQTAEGESFELRLSTIETSRLISMIYAERNAALKQSPHQDIEVALPIESLAVAQFPDGQVLRIEVGDRSFVDFHADAGSPVDLALARFASELAKDLHLDPVPIPAKTKN